jgi:signal peptidase
MKRQLSKVRTVPGRVHRWVEATSVRDVARRSIGVVAVLAVLALVIPFVVYAVPGVVGGSHSFIVLSSSMEPTMSPGDVIIVVPAEVSDLAVGDVVTFERNGLDAPVTHRVVAVGTDAVGPYAWTRGDANEDDDPSPVRDATLVGRVGTAFVPHLGTRLLVLPKLGLVVQFVNTPVGFALLVALPAAALVATELRTLIAAAGRTTRGDADASFSVTVTDDILTSEGDEDDATARSTVRTLVTGDERKDATGTVTFTKADLTVSVGVLAGFAAYSGAIAFNTRIAWAVAVFLAVVGGLLFAVGVRFVAPPSNFVGTSDPTTAAVVDARLPDAYRRVPRVTVESVSTLVAIANAIGRRVVRDTDGEGYFVPEGDVVYHVPDPDPRGDGRDEDRDPTPEDDADVVVRNPLEWLDQDVPTTATDGGEEATTNTERGSEPGSKSESERKGERKPESKPESGPNNRKAGPEDENERENEAKNEDPVTTGGESRWE